VSGLCGGGIYQLPKQRKLILCTRCKKIITRAYKKKEYNFFKMNPSNKFPTGNNHILQLVKGHLAFAQMGCVTLRVRLEVRWGSDEVGALTKQTTVNYIDWTAHDPPQDRNRTRRFGETRDVWGGRWMRLWLRAVCAGHWGPPSGEL